MLAFAINYEADDICFLVNAPSKRFWRVFGVQRGLHFCPHPLRFSRLAAHPKIGRRLQFFSDKIYVSKIWLYNV